MVFGGGIAADGMSGTPLGSSVKHFVGIIFLRFVTRWVCSWLAMKKLTKKQREQRRLAGQSRSAAKIAAARANGAKGGRPRKSQ